MEESSQGRDACFAPEVYITDIILPNQTNSHGTMFGGNVLALMDRAAGIAALRFCRLPVVTASTERIDFQTPIHEAEIIEARAKVIYVGRTSMIVRIRIYAEHPLKGEQRICTTGYFSMVAVDEGGRPVSVPQLQLRDAAERAEWQMGAEIRKMIQERQQASSANSG